MVCHIGVYIAPSYIMGISMKTRKKPKPVLDLVMPEGLKHAVEEAARRLRCSQAEVVRTALYEFLKDLSLIKEQIEQGGVVEGKQERGERRDRRDDHPVLQDESNSRPIAENRLKKGG